MAILQNLQNKTQAELIEMLMAQAKANERKISMKVSDKGALSVYGLGRFPVTLYRSQWERLIGSVDAIRSFIDANATLLATKD